MINIGIEPSSSYSFSHMKFGHKTCYRIRSCASISSFFGRTNSMPSFVISLSSVVDLDSASGNSDTHTSDTSWNQNTSKILLHISSRADKWQHLCISFWCSCVIDTCKQLHMNKISLAIHPQGRASNASCMLPSNRGALPHAPAWQHHFVHALMFAVCRTWNHPNPTYGFSWITVSRPGALAAAGVVCLLIAASLLWPTLLCNAMLRRETSFQTNEAWRSFAW